MIEAVMMPQSRVVKFIGVPWRGGGRAGSLFGDEPPEDRVDQDPREGGGADRNDDVEDADHRRVLVEVPGEAAADAGEDPVGAGTAQEGHGDLQGDAGWGCRNVQRPRPPRLANAALRSTVPPGS